MTTHIVLRLSTQINEIWAPSLFSMRHYASAVHVIALCPSVCLTQAGVLLKRLNVSSRKELRVIAQEIWFSVAKDLGEIPTVWITTNGSAKY